MTLLKSLATIVGPALVVVLAAGAQQKPRSPSIEFGGALVSLGMSVEQVETNLAGSARHLRFLADKRTAIVQQNGAAEPDGDEGQVTFIRGQAVYAQYEMPGVRTADELAQELAGAVDNMESKTCTASNYSTHGTGGGLSQIIFDCGSRRFNVQTVQVFGNSTRDINVNIEIGHLTP